MKILGYKISKDKNVTLANTTKPTLKKRALLSSKITIENTPQTEVEMENLKTAIVVAKDVENPNRLLLYGIYDKSVDEGHLSSQMRTAIFTILQSDFNIKVNGKINEDLKNLFSRGWFTDFITHAADAEFYGHSLIEFGYMNELNEFDSVKLIDRYNVIPEFGKIKLTLDTTAEDAFPYREKATDFYLIEVGGEKDLGLLKKAAVEVIWKNYSRSDWSNATEKFGMPLLTINTDTSDEKELGELEDMAQNFGSNGYIISSKETDVTIIQPDKGTQFYINYESLANFCDKQLSKLINGQVSTSDEKSFVGSAQVQERVLNTYTKARLERIERLVNEKLIPFLTYYGYPLKGAQFKYVDLEKREEIATVTDTAAEKKKLKLNYTERIEELYSSFQHNNNTVEIELSYSDNLKKLFDKAIKKIHTFASDNKQLSEVELIQLDEANAIITETAKVFQDGIKKGILSADFTPDPVFVEKLTKSTWIFSGFKTHRQLMDISAMLAGSDGKIKPFNIFRDDVLSIHEKYNVSYLNTEYNQAISASRQASKWKQYEQDGDKYFLQYRTAGDERVRSSHAALNNITLPLSDSFWDEHFSPNGWGCRCTEVQVLRSQHKETAQDFVKTKTENLFTGADKIFAYNPGKTEALFPPKHPYYNVQKSLSVSIKDKSDLLFKKELNRKLYNEFGADYIKEGFNEETGGFFVSHIDHLFDKKTGKYEKETAKALMNSGHRIILQSEKGLPDGVKICDGFIDDELMEIKTIMSNTPRSISRNLEESARKKAKYSILYFPDKYDKKIYLKGLDRFEGIAKKEKFNIQIIKIDRSGIK